jgi:Holliday junction resolvase RusA-like endonuclease
MIALRINGEPPRVTAQQKGVFIARGKPFFYTKQKIKDVSRRLIEHMTPHAPTRPIDCPCIVEVTYVWSFRAKDKFREGIVPHVERPDVDNLIKLVLDAMVEAKWIVDDSQVYQLRVSKYRGDRPHMTINLAKHISYEVA